MKTLSRSSVKLAKGFGLLSMMPVFVFLGILLTLVGNDIFTLLKVNAWSLNYLYVKKGRSETVIEALDQHARAPIWIARDLLVINNVATARALVEPLAENGNIDAMMVLGEVLKMEGDFAAAVATWSQTGNYRVLLNAASDSYTDGRLEDAMLAFRSAFEINREMSTLAYSTFLWDIGKGCEAEALLSEALSSYRYSRQRVQWFMKLGQLLGTQNRWDEAISTYHELLAESPDYWRGYIELGWAYYRRGDGVEIALSTFQIGISIDSTRGEGYSAIGRLLTEEQRYKEADSWYSQAVERNPNAHDWWLDWGNAMRESGDLAYSLTISKQIIEHFPDWPPGYYEAAWASHLAGSEDDALEYIEKAMALSEPPSKWYLLRAGKIFEWAGYEKEAISAYRKALEIDPALDAATQALERLLN